MTDLDDKRKNEAGRIIHGVAVAATSISSTMIPYSADTAALNSLYVGMIQALAKLFGNDLDARGAAGILREVSGPLLGNQASRTLLGWIPGLGNWVNTSVTTGLTEALGWRVYQYFSQEPRTPSTQNRRSQVFICYSHKDATHVDRLLLHLRPVEKLLRIFVDTSLAPGVQWRKEIQNALAEARVAVLFISADFAASDFIQKYEVPSLIDSAKRELTIILPIIVGPVVKTGIVSELLEYQSPAMDLQPLIAMKRPQREKAFVEIAGAIIDACSDVGQ
jgi:uncharacterized protein (DUF697 family)